VARQPAVAEFNMRYSTFSRHPRTPGDPDYSSVARNEFSAKGRPPAQSCGVLLRFDLSLKGPRALDVTLTWRPESTVNPPLHVWPWAPIGEHVHLLSGRGTYYAWMPPPRGPSRIFTEAFTASWPGAQPLTFSSPALEFHNDGSGASGACQ
jgi:hypothetical protein